MTTSHQLRQHPAPASRHYRFCGDTQTFRLEASAMGPGQAWLRTNIGYAAITRSEIIAKVHDQIAPLGKVKIFSVKIISYGR